MERAICLLAGIHFTTSLPWSLHNLLMSNLSVWLGGFTRLISSNNVWTKQWRFLHVSLAYYLHLGDANPNRRVSFFCLENF